MSGALVGAALFTFLAAPSPIAALVGTQGEGSLCSAAHLGSRWVVTAAHCFQASRNLARYFFAYRDRQGRLGFSRARSFYYFGNPAADDIAVIEIPPARVPWATFERLSPARSGVTHVTVWALDALQNGVKLVPRHCLASRTLPRAFGAVLDSSGREQLTEITSRKALPALNLFLDHCDRPLIAGNSGALITDRDFGALGVYHAGLLPRESQLRRFTYFRYWGNRGAERLTRAQARLGLFDIGTRLGAVSVFDDEHWPPRSNPATVAGEP